jgi:hypothetical protein
MSNRTTEKMYRGGQIEALYQKIFGLQTGAGWQDERDFTAWYASQGWRYGRPRDPGIPEAISSGGKQPHVISEAKVREHRQTMQAGRWTDASSAPIIVMADGEVMDGHHRLTAASGVDWAIVPNRPVFTVLFRSDLIPD